LIDITGILRDFPWGCADELLHEMLAVSLTLQSDL